LLFLKIIGCDFGWPNQLGKQTWKS